MMAVAIVRSPILVAASTAASARPVAVMARAAVAMTVPVAIPTAVSVSISFLVQVFVAGFTAPATPISTAPAPVATIFVASVPVGHAAGRSFVLSLRRKRCSEICFVNVSAVT